MGRIWPPKSIPGLQRGLCVFADMYFTSSGSFWPQPMPLFQTDHGMSTAGAGLSFCDRVIATAACPKPLAPFVHTEGSHGGPPHQDLSGENAD